MIPSDVLSPRLREAPPAPGGAPTAAVAVRPLQPSDKHALLAFFRRLPVNERGRFFPDAMIDPVLVAKWCQHWSSGRSRVMTAWSGERMIGGGAIDLARQHMHAHVGRIRMAVDPEYRRMGVGQMIMHELLDIAPNLGIEWLDAEVGSHEAAALRFLRRLSFHERGVLPDHGQDMLGGRFDVVLLARHVESHLPHEIGGHG